MRRLESEVIGGLFWMVVGLFFVIARGGATIGTLRSPGPGFLPLIMALILISFALFTLVKGLVRPERTLSRIPWRRSALTITSMFFYGLLLEFIGFLLATFILMFILFGILRGKANWSRVFLFAAATALGAWLLFSVALNIPFPPSRLLAIWR